MVARPATFAAQRPAIDNISIEDKFFAACMFEEVVYLVDLAIGCAEVYVG